MALGHERTEYYVSSKGGFKTLIGVSHGFDGGFVFNLFDETAQPNVKFFADFVNRKFKYGGFLVDNYGNKMNFDELFEFAAYTRDTKVPVGAQETVKKDMHGFRFGKYTPRLLMFVIGIKG